MVASGRISYELGLSTMQVVERIEGKPLQSVVVRLSTWTGES